MKKWFLIALGLALLSGCAGFKSWMTTHDVTKRADDLRLLESLLNNNQASRQLTAPPNLGEALSKMNFKHQF